MFQASHTKNIIFLFNLYHILHTDIDKTSFKSHFINGYKSQMLLLSPIKYYYYSNSKYLNIQT
jgi:hypothetical protein